VLGDVVSSAMYPPLPLDEPVIDLPLVTDVESAFYLHLEVEDRPRVLAQIAELLGMQEISVKSVVQKGMGDQARLVMVVHPVAESRFTAALQMIGGKEFVRSPPRAIRVIEEEFV
jgi:homoserine dehydrogenase